MRFGWSRHGLTYYDPATKTTRVTLRVILAHWVLAGISREVAAVRQELRDVQAEIRAARLELVEVRVQTPGSDEAIAKSQYVLMGSRSQRRDP